MPRIQDHLLNCSFYVYPNRESAERGDLVGGSGFLVNVPSEHEGWIHVYAVTNRHVLDSGGHVLRLNTRDGRFDVLETKPDSWFHHPNGDDIAAIPLELDSKTVRWFSVSSNRFITREILREYKIGPGDETFLIGRLVTLEGRSKNTPIVRFGNIAMMPEEQIDVGGTGRDAFLVECRSLSGLSGSPVFVTAERSFDGDTIPKDLQLKPDPTTGEVGDKIVAIGLARYGPWLLGVDFAHMPLWRPVYKSDRETRTPCMVEANTGIACVVPAWKLLEILNDEDLVKQRKIEDKEIGQKKKQSTESSRG